MTQSNAELVAQLFGGNVGAIPTGFKPGVPVALLLVPTGTKFSAANMLTQSAFITALDALTTHTTRSSRAFPLYGLDGFAVATKDTASQDTGMYQENFYDFPSMWNFVFKGAQGNMSNFMEFMLLAQQPGWDFFVIDSNSNFWGTQDVAGAGALQGFSLFQIWAKGWTPAQLASTAASTYPFSIQFANFQEFNQNFNYFCCPTFSATAFKGLQNVICYNAPAGVYTAVSATAGTDIVFLAKIGQNSADFVKTYGSALTAACFSAYNYSAAAAATISSITAYPNGVTVSGETYYPVKAVLSAAPTSTHVVGIGTSAPSAVNAVIPRLWCVTEVLQPGVDAQRQAVKTFA
jgi:hypothetical protein